MDWFYNKEFRESAENDSRVSIPAGETVGVGEPNGDSCAPVTSEGFYTEGRGATGKKMDKKVRYQGASATQIVIFAQKGWEQIAPRNREMMLDFVSTFHAVITSYIAERNSENTADAESSQVSPKSQ